MSNPESEMLQDWTSRYKMGKSQKLAHFQVPHFIHSPTQIIKEQELKTKDTAKSNLCSSNETKWDVLGKRERNTEIWGEVNESGFWLQMRERGVLDSRGKLVPMDKWKWEKVTRALLKTKAFWEL